MDKCALMLKVHLPGCRMAHQPIPRVQPRLGANPILKPSGTRKLGHLPLQIVIPWTFLFSPFWRGRWGLVMTNDPNAAALIKALKGAWEEIDSDTVRRICKEAKERFKTLVTNKGRYVE